MLWKIIILGICPVLVFSQEYHLAPSSTIVVSGTSTIHDWTAQVKKQTGKAIIQAKKKTKTSLKQGTLSELTVLVFAKDLESTKGRTMDSKMHKALKIQEFPTISYTLSHPIKFALIDQDGTSIKDFSGVLDIAGVEQENTADLEVKYLGNSLFLSGEIPLKLSDFSIDPPTAMFGQIETGNTITINFDLEFLPSTN